MEKINLREERDFGQKINATFLFLQQNFKGLFKSLLYYAGPLALLAGIFTGLYQSNIFNFSEDTIPAGGNPFEFLFASMFNVNYVLAMTLSVLTRIIVIGVTYAYFSKYLDDPYGQPGTPDVWSRLRHHFPRLFLSCFMYLFMTFFLAVSIGLVFGLLFFGTIPTNVDAILPNIFLIPLLALIIAVPVIFLAIRFSLFPAAIFMESSGSMRSFERSWKLVGGKWWSTFGLLVVVSIIVAIIGLAFQIPLLLISVFRELLQWEGGGPNQLIIILASVIGILGETMLYSIVNIAMGFQYFNLVERQESIGLMQEINSLGEKPDHKPNEGDY